MVFREHSEGKQHTRGTYAVLLLDLSHESLRVLDRLVVLQILRDFSDRSDFFLQLTQSLQNLRLAGGELLGHGVAQLQTHANIHRVIDKIRFVDDLQNLLP